MERLNRRSPSVPLTAEQKRQIAELESRHKARIAEREIALKTEMARAEAEGDAEKLAALEQQWLTEKSKLQADLEEKKEQVRQARA